MNDTNNNIMDKLIINHEILSANNLNISNIICTNYNKINLIGDISTQQSNMNKPVVIGAYLIKNDEIIQVSATSFNFKKIETRFVITFDDNNFDKIYLYAEILENKTEKVEEPVITHHHSQETTSNLKNLQNKKMTLLERVKSYIEMDNDALNQLGLKLGNINVVRKYVNEEFTIFSELECTKKLEKHGYIYCVIYDENDLILDSISEYINLRDCIGFEIFEWGFNVKPSQINKIRVFPKFEDL